MLRRSVPVLAAAAAAIAFVPGTASAAPDDAPTYHFAYTVYDGAADVVLEDGRQVSASLMKVPADRRGDGWASLQLRITQPCAPDAPYCYPRTTSADVYLPADQVTFDRRLRSASVENVTITVPTPGMGGGGYGMPGGPWTPPVLSSPQGDELHVSLTFTGSGALAHDVDHTSGECYDGSLDCQRHRTADEREASAVLTIDGEVSRSDSGLLRHLSSLDVAGKPNGSSNY